MRCSNCGATVRPGAKICVYCGERLAAGAGGSGSGRDRPKGLDFQAPWRSRYAADPDSGRPRGSPEPEDDTSSYEPPEDSREESAYEPGAPRSSGREEGRGNQRGGRRGGRAGYDDYDDEGGDERDDRDQGHEQSRGGYGYGGDETDEASGYEPNSPYRGRRPDPFDDPRAPRALRNPSPGRGDDRRPAGSPSWQRRPDSGYSRGYEEEQSAEYAADSGRGGRAVDYGRDPGSRRTPDFRPEMEDSWGMASFAHPAEPANWTDGSGAWGAAPSEAYSAARPRQRGRRPPPRSARPTTGGGGRRVGIILGIMALLVAVVVSGVLVVPKLFKKADSSEAVSTFVAYTPGPTPTIVPNYTFFQSSRSAYILNYPKVWSLKEEAATATGNGADRLDTFAQRDGVAMLRVEQADSFAAATDNQVIDAELANGRQQGITYNEAASANTMASIGGEQWTRREFDVTSNKVKYHMAILSCHHQGHGYVIVLVSAPADFAKLDSTIFQTMLSSFRFVG